MLCGSHGKNCVTQHINIFRCFLFYRLSRVLGRINHNHGKYKSQTRLGQVFVSFRLS